MLPSINIGTISTYYLSYLVGITIGWVMFVASEEDLYNFNNKCINLKTVLFSSIAYFVVVLTCIQGANYFHYLFDNIPESIRQQFTWKDIIFTDLLETVKVLYGAVFFYPLGILIASKVFLRKSFFDYLSRKGFILFFILGFARLGCFANGCCYGLQSDLFGICFPMGSAASAEHMKKGLTYGFMPPPSLPVIPTQIISAGVLFLFSFFCWKNYRRDKNRFVFLNYLFYYAVFRLLIEFVRDDLDRAYWWGISASQWMSLVLISCFSVYFMKRRNKTE